RFLKSHAGLNLACQRLIGRVSAPEHYVPHTTLLESPREFSQNGQFLTAKDVVFAGLHLAFAVLKVNTISARYLLSDSKLSLCGLPGNAITSLKFPSVENSI